MTLKEIAKIIQKRDGISYNEACDIVQECREQIGELMCEERPASVLDFEAIIEDYLGLEPDYLDAFIYSFI